MGGAGGGAAGVEGPDLLERQSVDGDQAGQAEVPLGALGWAAEDHVVGVRPQVADLGQLVLRRGGLGHDDRVLVLCRGEVERLEQGRVEPPGHPATTAGANRSWK